MFRTPFMQDRPEGPTVDCSEDEILTEQSHKVDADINMIINRHTKSGTPIRPEVPLQFGEARPFDLQEAYHILDDSREAFMGLSAKVRKRFNNDVMQFIQFFQNPANRDEAVELGFIDPPPPPPPPPSTEADPPASSSGGNPNE